MTAHWFTSHVLGQRQIVMTGWLEDGRYAPHTRVGYFMPPSKTLYRAAVGAATRSRSRSRWSKASMREVSR